MEAQNDAYRKLEEIDDQIENPMGRVHSEQFLEFSLFYARGVFLVLDEVVEFHDEEREGNEG